jgi:hypothetical protein
VKRDSEKNGKGMKEDRRWFRCKNFMRRRKKRGEFMSFYFRRFTAMLLKVVYTPVKAPNINVHPLPEPVATPFEIACHIVECVST